MAQLSEINVSYGPLKYEGGSVQLGTAYESPKALRKRAAEIERARKRERRDEKQRQESRRIVIDTFREIAGNARLDPHARIEAARELRIHV